MSTPDRKASVRDLEFAGRRVFCRVDFNVPLSDGRVTDDRRVTAALPTIRFLVEGGARVVLGSHLGRPKGRVDPAYSLAPAVACLAEHLGRSVAFAEDSVGPAVERAVDALEPGSVLLLENLRYHPGEEANDGAHADALARLADVYVNDAFGTAHRAHASTVGVPARVRPAAAGFLMDRELTELGRLLAAPARPFWAILGGAKVSDKIELIDNLLPRVDGFLVGGAMAYTFLAARGVDVGTSLVERDKLDLARTLLERVDGAGKALRLPTDHVVQTADGSATAVRASESIPDGESGGDIGPVSADAFAGIVEAAGTVLWNGPVGRFEMDAFEAGTRRVAEALAGSSATSVLGGGDTAAAARKFGVDDRMTHVSTGGGASLEFLSGRTLPGVAALSPADGAADS